MLELSNGALSVILMVAAVIIMLPGIIAFARGARESDRLNQRLERDGQTPKNPQHVDRTKSLGMIVSEIGKKLSPENQQQMSAIRFKLMRAGIIGPNAVFYFMAIRAAVLIVPQVLFFMALPFFLAATEMSPFLVSALLGVVGLLGPDKVVEGRIKTREDEYREGFPDMMDLLVACVEAGLSLDAAVSRVSEEVGDRYPNLAIHLNIIALELRAGRNRKDAWQNFASRVGLEEAGALATMLRQAEEMGTSLGQTLRVFSKTMRERRMLLAEEKALALPAKMTVPLIIFVFPTLMGVLILPAIARISGSI